MSDVNAWLRLAGGTLFVGTVAFALWLGARSAGLSPEAAAIPVLIVVSHALFVAGSESESDEDLTEWNGDHE